MLQTKRTAELVHKLLNKIRDPSEKEEVICASFALKLIWQIE
jgi:hypothetical protein